MNQRPRWILVLIFLLSTASGPVSGCSLQSSARKAGPFTGHINAVANRYGIDRRLVRAVIHVESSFNPYAHSHRGAQGLMQLMPLTQRDLGVHRAYDPAENINGGVRYLVSLLLRYHNLRKALWAYNIGPGRVDRGAIPPETIHYANRVLYLFDCYRRQDSINLISLTK